MCVYVSVSSQVYRCLQRAEENVKCLQVSLKLAWVSHLKWVLETELKSNCWGLSPARIKPLSWHVVTELTCGEVTLVSIPISSMQMPVSVYTSLCEHTVLLICWTRVDTALRSLCYSPGDQIWARAELLHAMHGIWDSFFFIFLHLSFLACKTVIVTPVIMVWSWLLERTDDIHWVTEVLWYYEYLLIIHNMVMWAFHNLKSEMLQIAVLLSVNMLTQVKKKKMHAMKMCLMNHLMKWLECNISDCMYNM